ncbi:hypothetical protein ROA7023_04445 [Roseisalinus antarcticus]|uniref:Uncharacterized protein n=1 Tax=Roseisalinus antarcticus TaxID=254357 RepID=A0A1Y5U5F5_9RHOB|nr:hypothetical protein ROA7023_04445 [Roseisalinus antarcticus]
MPQHDHRRLFQPQLRGGQHAPMPGDQLAILGHEARHGPAELGHAGGKLCDLVGTMLLGIAGIGLEPGQRPVLDPLGGEGEGHVRVILFDRFRCNAKRDSSMKSCYIRILYWCPVAQPEGMRCTLLSASVASIHSGERGFGGNSGRRCRRTGRQDEFLQRGLHWTPSWIPAGLRSPGYPPRSPPYKPLLLRGYFRFRGGLHAGWTPKKTALSLAKLRASPASIRSARKGTVKSMA